MPADFPEELAFLGSALGRLHLVRAFCSEARIGKGESLTSAAAGRNLQLAEAELQAGHTLFMGELATGAAAGRIVHLRTWCTVLEIRRNERAAALAEARRNVNDAFRLMTAAVREREALDRFHEKSQHLWQRAFHADEQKMFDELAVQRQSAATIEKSLLN